MMNGTLANPTLRDYEPLMQLMESLKKNQHNEIIPARCSICGKPIACCYPETVPGMIFATCRSGHKIKIRKEDFPRKAV